MSATGSHTPGNHFGGSFGPNEWLVDEMYEKFLADPASIDLAWHEFFADYSKAAPVTKAPAPTLAPLANAPQGGNPPLPKSAIATTPVTSVPVQPPVQPPIQPPAPIAAPVMNAKPVTQEPITPSLAQDPAKAPVSTPADPVVKPLPTLVTPSAASVEPIRGVAARVVQSMEASLTVPTATSVRAIPAKLMIDNRTVINNHLKRGRGGKVSFTHIIGYAMVKAIRQMPEMNAFFTEVDGKPAIGRPEHINIGIAIDLAKADGSRHCSFHPSKVVKN